MVDEFADAVASDPEYPQVVFVYQGTADQGPMFFDKLFPKAQAIADPTGSLYADFGVERGGMRAMFGARAWACGLKAVSQGHVINRKVGDPWTLPTVFAIEPPRRGGEGTRIVWAHRGEHAGDHPDIHHIPTLIERTTA